MRIRLEGREDGNVIAHALGGHASNVVISGNLVLASFRNTFSSQLANALQAQGFGVLKNKEVGEASVTLQYGYRTVVPIIWTITKRVPAPPPQSPKDFSFDREVTVGERFGGIESLSFEIRFSDKSGKPLPGMLNVNSATSGNWDVELKEMARELAKRIRKNVPMEVGSR
uniref:Uncharacterized protein n=1 Tax=uncultured Desulfobacterium sp. TaxID=201089 RepID=E1YIA7_9BACT|nr:unknown protein [uncultured Desulfobacterium sp.]